jgi:hypothetical protein
MRSSGIIVWREEVRKQNLGNLTFSVRTKKKEKEEEEEEEIERMRRKRGKEGEEEEGGAGGRRKKKKKLKNECSVRWKRNQEKKIFHK